MGKIYRRDTLAPKKEPKKKDDKARKRNQILNFRVSPEEKEVIERKIALSGLPKSKYFIESCTYQSILVRGNIRTFDKMRERMNAINNLFLEIAETGKIEMLDEYILAEYRMILEILEQAPKREG